MALVGPTEFPPRLPRAMRAEAVATGEATWANNNINTAVPTVAIAKNFNTWLQIADQTMTALLENAARGIDVFGPFVRTAIIGNGLTWATGVGLTVAATGDIFFLGNAVAGTVRRLDLFASGRLSQIQEDTHTFPPNTRVWVYASGAYMDDPARQVGGQGTLQPAALPTAVDLYFDDVGAGNPPAPPAGYFVVGGADTDGVNVTANLAASIPSPDTLTFGVNVTVDWEWTDAKITIDDSNDETALDIIGGNTIAPTLFVRHRSGVAGGSLIQGTPDNTSAAPALSIDGTHLAETFSFAKSSGSGRVGRIDQSVDDEGLAIFMLGAFAAGRSGLEIDCSAGTGARGLRVIAGTEAHVRMNTLGADVATPVNGDLWFRSGSEALSIHRQGGIRRVWNTTDGLTASSFFTSANVNVVTPAGANTLIQQLAGFSFKQNGWYYITVRASLNMNPAAGIPLRVEVNGVAAARFPSTAYTVTNQPGGYGLAFCQTFKYQWTLADAAANIDFLANLAAVGAGTFSYALREIEIDGVLEG